MLHLSTALNSLFSIKFSFYRDILFSGLSRYKAATCCYRKETNFQYFKVESRTSELCRPTSQDK